MLTLTKKEVAVPARATKPILSADNELMAPRTQTLGGNEMDDNDVAPASLAFSLERDDGEGVIHRRPKKPTERGRQRPHSARYIL